MAKSENAGCEVEGKGKEILQDLEVAWLFALV